MIRLTIRWRAILAPWCWLTRHLWYGVEAGTWADDSGYHCTRCARYVSLNRCTCGHPRYRHLAFDAYCEVEGCTCAAFVTEAYEAGAHRP